MSLETFDPITRNIRAIESDALNTISGAEKVIASMRRKRSGVTVAACQKTFADVGDCLQITNQIYDSVVAHSHIVADNIAERSKAAVLLVRDGLLEAANELLSLCEVANVAEGLPEGVYNPSGAFRSIGNALMKNGLASTDDMKIETYYMDRTSVGYIATYSIPGFLISVVVTVSCNPNKNLGEGSDEIIVSVWEDRLPPVWDTSYHKANGEPLNVGPSNGKSLGKWTKQTDNALVDYVATVLSKDVVVQTNNKPAASPATIKEATNRYGTHIGRMFKQGSDKFDYQSQASILKSAVTGFTKGPQGELIINTDPRQITKSTLARFVLDLIASHMVDPVQGSTRLSREGYYQLIFPSYASSAEVTRILNGEFA